MPATLNPADLAASPSEKANFWSILTFKWMWTLLRKGYSQPLELQDMYRPNHSDTVRVLCSALENAWSAHILECDKLKKKPSLNKVLLKLFGMKFAACGILLFINECIIKILLPVCLVFLLTDMDSFYKLKDESAGKQLQNVKDLRIVSTCSIGALLALAWAYIFTFHITAFDSHHVWMRVRIACNCVVYRKILRLNQSAFGDSFVAEIVNMFSNDINRLDRFEILFNYLWVAPIHLGIVIIFLWNLFGVHALFALPLLVIYIPGQIILGSRLSNLRLETSPKTHQRMKIITHIIHAISSIKMYAWEKYFRDKCEESRKEEVRCIKKTMKFRIWNSVMSFVASKLSLFSMLVNFDLHGGLMTASNVFAALILFENVRHLTSILFPIAVADVAEAVVSLKKIEEFLLRDERMIMDRTVSANSQSCPSTGDVIAKLENASFNIGTHQMDIFCLTDISLKLERKKLTALIGPVGSGKTCVLKAVMGEIQPVQGKVTINGTIGFVAQEPWLFRGTMKENIIFGRPFNSSWYKVVLESCVLDEDVLKLPQGDDTLIDSLTMSKGQRYRITLARAVYSDADIYLLDDPLSAVDTGTARLLMEKCIRGILRGKAVLLITSQLHYLDCADEIILLNEGNITVQGSYSYLKETEGVQFVEHALVYDEDEADVMISTEHNGETSHIEISKDFMNPKITQYGSGNSIWSLPPTSSHFIIREEIFQVHEVESLNSIQDVSFSRIINSQELTMVEEFNEEEPEVRTSATFAIFWKFMTPTVLLVEVVFLIFTVLCQAGDTASELWLEAFTQRHDRNHHLSNITSISNQVELILNIKVGEILVFLSIVSCVLIFIIIRNMLFFDMCIKSGIALHHKCLDALLLIPMTHFKRNPIGRILNRFSKDVGTIDDLLPPTLYELIETTCQIVGLVVLASLVRWYYIIPSLIIIPVNIGLVYFYYKSAKRIKYLESISRIPVLTNLNTVLRGIATIHSFHGESMFLDDYEKCQDIHTATWSAFLASQRWVLFMVDCSCMIFVMTACFIALLIPNTDPAEIGIAIFVGLAQSTYFETNVRLLTEVNTQMMSVERLLEMIELGTTSVPENNIKPPSNWPQNGRIVFKNLHIKPAGEHIEKQVITSEPQDYEINLIIESREKIAIVGRNGCGKDELLSTLFRFENNLGIIEIDGIDISKISLYDLRSKISVIPPDPIIFMGTVRQNFDPFHLHTDDEIWEVLRITHLESTVRNMSASLETEITDETHLSVGQKQLVCIGRTLLQKNKILVCDIDPETDKFVQTILKEVFNDCTIITAAHRLETVIDNDKILLLENRIVTDFDEPYKLLTTAGNSFSKFLVHVTDHKLELLRQHAKEAHDAHSTNGQR